MDVRAATAEKRGVPAWVWRAIIYAFSILCLLWVYQRFEWRSELARLKHVHWSWIALAAFTDVAVYFIQAWRWNVLLTPIAKVPLWRSVQAIYIGMFANEVLPLRSGELIRGYLVSRWDHVPLPLVLSSELIERLIDGVLLIVGFVLIVHIGPSMRPELLWGTTMLGILVAAVGAFVVFAVISKRFAHHVTTKHRWAEPMRLLVEGLHAMGGSKELFVSIAISGLYLGLQVIPVYAMMAGFSVPGLDVHNAAVVLVLLRLSTIVPGLPGNLGLFNGAAFWALHHMIRPRVEEQLATSLATAMFIVITVPLLIGGWIALAAAGLDMGEVYRKAHSSRPAARPVKDSRAAS